MSIRRRRIVLWTLAAVTLAVLCMAPASWPRWIVERLDHCPELGCDFVHHYIAQARQLRGDLVFGWVYPPLLALGLQPLTAFSDAGALRVWMLLQALAVASLALACRQLLQPCGRFTSWAGAAALVLPSLPVLHAFKWGQVSTFIAAGAVWALCSPRARSRGAGVMLGILGALKLYPLVYLAPALRRRDRKQVTIAFVTAVVLGVLLPLAILGPQTTWRYFASAFAVKWNYVGYLGGQALWPTLVRLFVTGRHAGVEPESHAPLLFSIGDVGTASLPQLLRAALLTLPALVVAGWTLRALWRDGAAAVVDESAAGGARTVTAMRVLVATALCLAPGWHHYFAFLPVAMAAVLAQPSCRRLDVVLVVVAWLATAMPVFGLAAGNASYFHASQWGCTTWAALLVWWALMRAARSPVRRSRA